MSNDKDRKLDKLKQLMALISNDTITPEQVKGFLEVVLKVIKDAKTNFEGISKENIQTIKDALEQIETQHNLVLSEVSQEAAKVSQDYTGRIAEIKSLLKKVEKVKATPGQDGYTPVKGVDYFDGRDGFIGKDGKDGSPDDRMGIVKKINIGGKNDLKIEASQVVGFDKAKKDLDFALGVLDQRTQFLINKTGGSGTIRSIVAGTNITVDSTDSQNPIVSSTGGGTPGGSDTQVQFNDGGSFGGDAGLTYNKTTDVLTINTILFGKGAGTASILIGISATAGNTNNIGIGNTAVASGTLGAIAIGGFSTAAGATSVAIGSDSSSGGVDSVAIGNLANASGAQGTAVGEGTLASGIDSVAFGTNSIASGSPASVALGSDARATGAYALAIGSSSRALANAIAIGQAAKANVNSGTGSVVIGDNANSDADGGVSIGRSTINDGIESIAIGAQARADTNYSMALGKDARTTAANEIVFGSDLNDGTGFDSMWFGQSKSSTQTSHFTMNVTSQSGTNKTGNNLTLAMGKSTGTGVGGDFIVQTSDAGASGSTLRTLTNKFLVKGDGLVHIIKTGNTLAAILDAVNIDTSDKTFTFPNLSGTFALTGVSHTVSFGATTVSSLLVSANDGGAIGASGTAFSDLFLASGAVINFNSGNMTLTHAAGALTLAGGTLTLAENASVALDPAGSADGKYTGTTVTGTSGYTQAFGDCVYLDPTDSRWEACDANAAAGADGDSRGIVGIVVVAGTDGNSCTILLSGIIRADAKFPTFTVNNPVYVSETAGVVTQTQPATTDNVIRICGFALTADEMYWNPENDYITRV